MDRVSQYFADSGLPLKALFTGQDTSTVPKAAAVLGVEEGQIAKSLALRTKEGGAAVLVTAGTARIDNRSFKNTFRCKARMLGAEETAAETGHGVGGVCPFALPPGVPVYLDESLKQYTTVYPAAGTPDSAVAVPVAQLARYTGGSWVNVCKPPDAPAAE